MRLRGEILRPDGSEVFADEATCAVEDGAELGREMAGNLLAEAGPDFFAAVKVGRRDAARLRRRHCRSD